MAAYRTPRERCDLLARVYRWLFDITDSWETLQPETLSSMNYLAWAITDMSDPSAFEILDASVAKKYKEFIDLLKKHPNGLLDDLVENKFITIPEPEDT